MHKLKMSKAGLSPLDAADLEEVYKWVDEVRLSRPKKHIARDFSDGGER